MATIRLDVVWYDGETYDSALAELTSGLDVQAAATGVVAGGGWPEVQFSGARDALLELIRRYVADPDDPEGVAASYAQLIDA